MQEHLAACAVQTGYWPPSFMNAAILLNKVKNTLVLAVVRRLIRPPIRRMGDVFGKK